MGFLADYHVHMEKGPLEPAWRDAFIEAARRQGLAEMGFSEHIGDFHEGQTACGRWWEVEGDPEDRAHAERWWCGAGGRRCRCCSAGVAGSAGL